MVNIGSPQKKMAPSQEAIFFLLNNVAVNYLPKGMPNEILNTV
jgi:hypothetical protein